MSLSPQDQTFIHNLRLRMVKGHENPPTLDEMKRSIIILRESRRSAAVANAASGKKVSKAKIAPSASNIADALADLDNM